MMNDRDVTALVDFGPNDPEHLSLAKCVCDATFLAWDHIVGIYRDWATPCPHCGRKLYFSSTIQVYEVIDKEDEAAEQTAKAKEFDEYEIYYRNELIAEVKDYRKGFESVFYDLSDTTVVQKPPRKSLKIMPNNSVINLR